MGRKHLISILYVIIILLLAVNLFVVHQEAILGRHQAFAWRFYFDRRFNFPFFYSITLQFVNLVLLFRITRSKELLSPIKTFWTLLFVTFFLFAIDEAFYIHQHFKMSTFGRIASYDRASWTHYLWIIPYFVVFGTLLICLFKMSRMLPPIFKRKLLLAGFIFLFGAVALEFAGTLYAVINPKNDIYLLLIKTAEASLQLIGSVMFINTFCMALEANIYSKRL